jgi:aryl sulfotransferase
MAGPQGGGKPPWIVSERQHGIELRDGDIWISAPPKSGTNWMMNIVHQLLTGGDDSFDSIYRVVPWPEFVERPGQPASEIHARLLAMPRSRRRAFKSHDAPPDLPFVKVGSGKNVKYIVVCRNPEEALVSFKVFLDMHTDAFYDLWQVPKAAMTRPTFEAFYREVVDPGGMQGMFFGFPASLWPLRNEPNVLVMHFADMKKDLHGATRKVAAFLGIQPTQAQWAKVNSHASFDWMKQNMPFDTPSRVRAKRSRPPQTLAVRQHCNRARPVHVPVHPACPGQPALARRLPTRPGASS